MIVDTSAAIAIIRSESDSDRFKATIADAFSVAMSAATFVEISVVLNGGRDAIALRRFDDFISENGIVIEPVTESQARIAREAYRDFGRGSEHPANLNFGDCFAYALAVTKKESLLFKGDDFRHTDIEPAL